MKAALVTTFGENPRYADVPEPTATENDEVVVDVLASALSPRVRSQAAGSHYTSTGDLPLTPGIDGVGRLTDGTLVYFLLPDTNKGSMAERVTIDRRRAVPLAADADPAQIAAAMNPAMASWVALRQRITFEPGQSIMVLGATGNAGRSGVEVAHRLGAGDIIAVGRGAKRMQDLGQHGVTSIIDLDEEAAAVTQKLSEGGKAVDVVLDFLWGEPTSKALYAIIPNRTCDEQLLNWIQIGSVAGRESCIPSAALRAVNLRIIGSGQGSVEPRAYRQEIETLAKEIHAGNFNINIRRIPLSDVEKAWADSTSAERLVIIP